MERRVDCEHLFGRAAVSPRAPPAPAPPLCARPACVRFARVAPGRGPAAAAAAGGGHRPRARPAPPTSLPCAALFLHFRTW